MDLSPYVQSVHTGLTNAAALADEHTQQVARQLGQALDSTTRLALISALSDASSQISADLAPGSVDVRLVDGDPVFVVSTAAPVSAPTLLVPEPPQAPAPPATEEPPAADDDEPLARISLRLPTSVKEKVDRLADADGISTNAWLVRAIMDALGEGPRAAARVGGSASGLAAGWFPGGVFGPHGVFGPGGVFGTGGPFADRRDHGTYVPPTPPAPPHPADWADSDRPGDHDDRSRRGDRSRDGRDRWPGSGAVQGWVR